MADQDKTAVSVDEYNKAIERAQRFEGQLVDLQKQLENFKGIDPREHRALKEEYENLRKKATGGDEEKINQFIADKEKEFEKRYGDKFSELNTNNEKLSREIKELRVIEKALLAAGEHFHSNTLGLLRREFESELDFLEGEIVAVQDGKPRPSKADPRKPMGLKEYLQLKTEAYPELLKARTKSGVGGANGSTYTPSGGGSISSLADLSRLPDGGKEAMQNMVKTKEGREQLQRMAQGVRLSA